MNSDPSEATDSNVVPSERVEAPSDAGKGPETVSQQTTPQRAETRSSEPDWKYEDPSKDPDRKGLLLSNDIERFCSKGYLIKKDYKEKNLRPASYTLTVGRKYVDSSGKMRKMEDNEPFFYMEPNSIVYVSTSEELDLPFYIAARFNLRVKWVYKGILLGTGPQVEPGFTGYLSCPLFNLTNKAIRVKLWEEFATIDFERTTNFCPGCSPDEIRKSSVPAREKSGTLMENLDQVSSNNDRFLLFRQTPFPPLKHLPDHDIISSLTQMADDVKKWRAIGIGTVVAFFALTLTLLNFQNNLYRELQETARRLTSLQEQFASQNMKAPVPVQGYGSTLREPEPKPAPTQPKSRPHK